MPLFGSKEKTQPPPVETKSNSLFGKSSSSTTTPATTTSSHSRNPFKRDEDPSIAAARTRVQNAENSERAADKALMEARASVKSAREEVRRLEREAGEEAKAALHKQKMAGDISKRAKPLGRHS